MSKISSIPKENLKNESNIFKIIFSIKLKNVWVVIEQFVIILKVSPKLEVLEIKLLLFINFHEFILCISNVFPLTIKENKEFNITCWKKNIL